MTLYNDSKIELKDSEKKVKLILEISRLPDGDEKESKKEELKKIEKNYKDKVDGVSLEERQKQGAENMPTVPYSYVDEDDNDGVDLFIKTYGKYGFKFSSDYTSDKSNWLNYSDYDNPVKGGNQGAVIFVTAQNGEQAAFDVDSWNSLGIGSDKDAWISGCARTLLRWKAVLTL